MYGGVVCVLSPPRRTVSKRGWQRRTTKQRYQGMTITQAVDLLKARFQYSFRSMEPYPSFLEMRGPSKGSSGGYSSNSYKRKKSVVCMEENKGKT